MQIFNNVVLAVVLVLSFGLIGCDGDDSGAPAGPSVVTMQDAPRGAPSTPVQASPATFNADNLRPDINEGFNAYDFHASYDGSMLNLILVEDEMRSMREASKPHRNRMITVGVCPSEPHHIMQACGDPVWQGSMRLADRLELPAIPLASCEGWIVVYAAEMHDDKYDGWRNAPCPAPGGEPVASDGTGAAWPDYGESDPSDPRNDAPVPQPSIGLLNQTRCISIRWLEPRRGFAIMEFNFAIRNTCDRALWVFWSAHNDDPAGRFYDYWLEEFTLTPSRVGGSRLIPSGTPAEPAEVECETSSPRHCSRFYVDRRLVSSLYPERGVRNEEAPEVRYCANPAVSGLHRSQQDHFCLTVTPAEQDRTKVGRSLRPDGVTFTYRGQVVGDG